MKKKRMTGASHYKENLGLKAILVYVGSETHAKLLQIAKKEGSLQKLIRKVLDRYVRGK